MLGKFRLTVLVARMALCTEGQRMLVWNIFIYMCKCCARAIKSSTVVQLSLCSVKKLCGEFVRKFEEAGCVLRDLQGFF
jgi:hypothetical protein